MVSLGFLFSRFHFIPRTKFFKPLNPLKTMSRSTIISLILLVLSVVLATDGVNHLCKASDIQVAMGLIEILIAIGIILNIIKTTKWTIKQNNQEDQ